MELIIPQRIFQINTCRVSASVFHGIGGCVTHLYGWRLWRQKTTKLSITFELILFMKAIAMVCIVLAGLFLFSSCISNNKNSYAIKDFSNSLQPYLTTIVSSGIVGYDSLTYYVRKNATDEELRKLSKCEHPILRAVAFREMLDRKTFDHFNLIMNNLDDTAMIITDQGEFGLSFTTVSDDILEHGKWKDTVAKNKTIAAIITKHNYLTSAYKILSSAQLKPDYYPYIKDMAQRPRRLSKDGYEVAFDEKEYALYGLAQFRKPEDIPIIKEALLSNCWKISEISFRLMHEYPDSSYLGIFENYYRRTFYKKVRQESYPYSAEGFINAVAVYKNERSEKILSTILHRSPFMPYPSDTSSLKTILSEAIWNNKCDAYSKLIKQIEPVMKEYEKDTITFPIDPVIPPIKTEEEPVRWWW